jgi:type IV pilus assembly protein PilA
MASRTFLVCAPAPLVFATHVLFPRPPNNRAFTLVEIMVVVVIISLLVTLALPAFQKIRQSSQDKAVLNNARLLSAAADQYFLEQGMTTTNLSMLLGPTNYVKSLATVAGETYPLTYQTGSAITVAGVAGLRTITFTP